MRETYQVRRTTGQVTCQEGILECRLYGGKKVHFCIGRGYRIDHMLQVLQYYQIPYQVGNLIYN